MKTQINVVLAGVLVIFTFITTFGLGLSMKHDMQGSMVNCPLMSGSTTLCQMNPLEHITKWQQLFTTTRQTDAMVLIVALFILGSTILLLKMHSQRSLLQIRLYTYHKRKNPQMQLFNHLLLAFSNGVLHPKLYA